MIAAAPRLPCAPILLAALAALAALDDRASSEPDDRIRESARDAELAWQRSCPDGSCITRRTVLACGWGPIRTPVVAARDGAQLRRAEAASDVVVAAYEAGWRDPAVVHAYLAVKLARADLAVERHLATPLADRRGDAAVERLRTGYAELATLSDLGALAAQARLGELSRLLGDELRAAPIPPDHRDAHAVCRGMPPEPLRWRALEELDACVGMAGKLGLAHPDDAITDEILAWSRGCAAGRSDIDPDGFPPFEQAWGGVPRRAAVQIELHNFEEALRQLAALDDPAHPYDVLNARAVVLADGRAYDAVHAAYRRAIALRPDRPEAYFNLGLLQRVETAHSSLDMVLNLYTYSAEHFEHAARLATGDLARRAREEAKRSRELAELTKLDIAEAHARGK